MASAHSPKDSRDCGHLGETPVRRRHTFHRAEPRRSSGENSAESDSGGDDSDSDSDSGSGSSRSEEGGAHADGLLKEEGAGGGEAAVAFFWGVASPLMGQWIPFPRKQKILERSFCFGVFFFSLVHFPAG